MAMAIMMRGEMTEEEKKRREEMLTDADAHTPGLRAVIEERLGRIEENVVACLLAEKRHPYVSASHFYWMVDYFAWKATCKSQILNVGTFLMIC